VADRPGPEAQGRLLTFAPDEELGELAARLQALALARGLTVGTAESCTGGLVGATITRVPGASAYYLGGVISYADDVKRALLAVPPEALARHGAVSAQVAVAMAEGLRARLGCDLAVSVTGVAGPDGGSEAKPVGLTYVAVAGQDGHRVERHVWAGDRHANQRLSAAAALSLLLATLEQERP
jgi:PncC family amidohydrolase